MIKNLLITVCALALSCVPTLAQSNIDVTVVGQGEKLNVPVYRVAITSDNQTLLAGAKRAFSLHGSYIQTSMQKAQFTINFAQVGTSAVKVSIKGGSTFEETVSAPILTEALMKACDVVVLRTLGKPGFFAGKLAFSYSRSGAKTSEICVSDMIFSNVRALTRDNSDSLMPHFSPDGKKIMYTGYYRSGFMDLFQIDLSSNSRKAFSSFKGSNTGGEFSPDCRKVALILTASGNAEVWTANAAGGGFKKMTNTSATESSASYSPDGSMLLFASDLRGSPQIYTMSANGGQLKSVPTNISRYCSEPTWNKKDPNKIAFTIAQGSGFQVAVYDFSTRQSQTISSGHNTSTPKWLNDGRHIVCAKANGNSRQLFIIDTETKRQAPLHTTSFGSLKEPDFVY